MNENEYRNLYRRYGLKEGETLIREVIIGNPLKNREKMKAYLYAGNILRDEKGNIIADLTNEYSLPEEVYDSMLEVYIKGLSEEENQRLENEKKNLEQHKEEIRKSIEDNKKEIREEITKGMQESFELASERQSSKKRNDNNSVLFLTITIMVLSIILNIGVFTGLIPLGKEKKNNYIEVIRLNKDISRGEQITSADLDKSYISMEEYNRIASTVFIDESGEIHSSITVLYSNADRVAGKYATRNLQQDSYITNLDFTSQRVLEERTEIEIEIEGKLVSIPVENILNGDTKIKIIALINSEQLPRQIALPLSEFVLADRSVQDILSGNGQSILEAIAESQKRSNDSSN